MLRFGQDELRSLRTRRWKYIRYLDAQGDPTQEELFDLQEDPGELRNLSEERPELLARMSERLDETMAQYGAKAGTEERIELDEDSIERLRSLGYLE